MSEVNQTTRVPLQVGMSSLKGTLRALIALVVGLILTGLFLYALIQGAEFVHDDPYDDSDLVITHLGYFVLAILLGALALLTISLTFIFASNAKANRPSDLMFEPAGLRIDGAKGKNEIIPWSQIETSFVAPSSARPAPTEAAGGESPHESEEGGELGQPVEASNATGAESSAGADDGYTLGLRLHDGQERILVEKCDAREVEFLSLLSRSIDALCRSSDEADAPAVPADPSVFRCGQCGAELHPRDADTVSCPHCSAANDVPAPLRETLREPQQNNRKLRAERKIRRLLRQPGPRPARFFLFMFRWTTYLIVPAAVVALWALNSHAQTGGGATDIVVVENHSPPYFWQALIILGFAVTVLAALWFFVGALLSSRRALSLVSLQLRAVPPERPGDTYACRGCGAPLPESPERIMLACVSCGIDNVVGCDLLRAVRRTTAFEHSAISVLRHRRRARLRLAVALAIAPFAVYALGAEALRVAHWAPASKGSSDVSEGEWPPRARAMVENRDRRHRTLTISDEGNELTRTLPGRSTALVTCLYSTCTLEAGGDSKVLDDSRTVLVLRRGSLRTAPEEDD